MKTKWKIEKDTMKNKKKNIWKIYEKYEKYEKYMNNIWKIYE